MQGFIYGKVPQGDAGKAGRLIRGLAAAPRTLADTRPRPPARIAANARLLAPALCFALALQAPLFAQSAPGMPSGLPAAPAAADSGAAAAPADSPAAPAPGDLIASTLASDIGTASWYELLDWCARLGLVTDGSRADLVARLLDYYKLPSASAPAAPAPGAEPAKAESRITVERAESTEYLTVEGEKIVRLRGGVAVTYAGPAAGESHRIEADEVLYNQARRLIVASGHVVYTRKSAGSAEVFRAGKLEFGIDDWRGFILDAESERASKDGSGAVYSFSARTADKVDADTMVLTDAVITSGDLGDPDYSIAASRLWLLGSGEWAVSDATLRVGEVPVLYLPFFFYPGSEPVFNPYFGNRPREGYFAQTTTYLLGKKAASADDGPSVLRMFSAGPSGDSELRGMFLRPAGSAAGGGPGGSASGADTLKLLADLYTNLGLYVGVEGKFPSFLSLGALTLEGGIGFSRSVYQVASAEGTVWAPYVAAHGFESVWNTSWLMGAELPFRFCLDAALAAQSGPLSVTFSFPLYSDPYVDQDFHFRKEKMNVLSFLGNSATETAPAPRTSLLWKTELSWAPPLPALSPWISSFRVSKALSSLSFASKTATPAGGGTYETVDPRRSFFYPDLSTPIDLSLLLTGTLFQLPAPARPAAPATAPAASTPAAPVPEADPATEPMKPWADAAATTAPAKVEATFEALSGFESPDPPYKLALPAAAEPFTASLGYSIDPRFYLEQRFPSSSWSGPEKIDVSQLLSSLDALRANAGLSLALRGGGLVSFSQTISLSSSYQDYGYLNAAFLAAAEMDSLRLAALKASYLSLSGASTLTVAPFAGDPALGATSLSWSMSEKLYDRRFPAAGTLADGYAETFFAFDAAGISAHSLAAALALRLGDFSGTLSVSGDLPPRESAYSLSLSASAFGLSLTASTKETEVAGISTWQPLSADLGYALREAGLTAGQSVTYNIMDARMDSATTRFGWGGFTSSLSMKYTDMWKLSAGTGWAIDAARPKAFVPTSLAMGYSLSLKSDPMWKGRILMGLSMSTNLALDFLKYTNSSLGFTMSYTLSIYKELDLSFSVESRNAMIYRYLVGIPGFPNDLGFAPRDPFLDLLWSFNFFNDADRAKSFFKLRSVSIKVARRYEDWTLSLSYSGKPQLQDLAGVKSYTFASEFSFAVAWAPIKEVSRTVVSDGTNLTFR